MPTTRKQTRAAEEAIAERQKALLGSLLTNESDILVHLLEFLANRDGEKDAIRLLCTSKATYSQTVVVQWLARRYNQLKGWKHATDFQGYHDGEVAWMKTLREVRESRFFVDEYAEEKKDWESQYHAMLCSISDLSRSDATVQDLPAEVRESYAACTHNLELFRRHEEICKRAEEVEKKLSVLAPMATRSWYSSDLTKTMKTRPMGCVTDALIPVPSIHAA